MSRSSGCAVVELLYWAAALLGAAKIIERCRGFTETSSRLYDAAVMVLVMTYLVSLALVMQAVLPPSVALLPSTVEIWL